MSQSGEFPKTLEWPEGSGQWVENTEAGPVGAEKLQGIATLIIYPNGVREDISDLDKSKHNGGWFCGAVAAGSALYEPCAPPVTQEETPADPLSQIGALYVEWREAHSCSSEKSDLEYQMLRLVEDVKKARAVEQKPEPRVWSFVMLKEQDFQQAAPYDLQSLYLGNAVELDIVATERVK